MFCSYKPCWNEYPYTWLFYLHMWQSFSRIYFSMKSSRMNIMHIVNSNRHKLFSKVVFQCSFMLICRAVPFSCKICHLRLEFRIVGDQVYSIPFNVIGCNVSDLIATFQISIPYHLLTKDLECCTWPLATFLALNSQLPLWWVKVPANKMLIEIH